MFLLLHRVKYRKKVPLGTGTVPVQMWTVPNPRKGRGFDLPTLIQINAHDKVNIPINTLKQPGNLLQVLIRSPILLMWNQEGKDLYFIILLHLLLMWQFK